MLHQSQADVLARMFGQVPPAIEAKANCWVEAYFQLTGEKAFVPQEIVAAWATDWFIGQGAPTVTTSLAFTQPGQHAPVQPQPPQSEEVDPILSFDGANAGGMEPAYFEASSAQPLTVARLTELALGGQAVSCTFIHPRTNQIASGVLTGQRDNMAQVRTSSLDSNRQPIQETVLVSPSNVQA